MKTVISDKLIKLLQFRINQEELSSRLYLAMSKWLCYKGFAGASKLWKKYSCEELVHAKWAYTFLSDIDVLPQVNDLIMPSLDFTGLVDIIEQSYKHEIFIMQQCNELFTVALKEGCGMVTQLALKYQKEQAEELGKTSYWLDRLEAFGDDDGALRSIDKEMYKKAKK